MTVENNLRWTQLSASSASVNNLVNNSVFQKLEETNDHLITANCNCYVIDNYFKYALKALLVDVESVVIKPFNGSQKNRTLLRKNCHCEKTLFYIEAEHF